jgi:hypothetical protein
MKIDLRRSQTLIKKKTTKIQLKKKKNQQTTTTVGVREQSALAGVWWTR